jgi:3-oxoacyl-[acyl-carrier protein] reductase
VLQFDIGARAVVAATLEADIAQHGCYYGVVCNAGVVRDNVFPALSGEDWDMVLKTNLDGFYNVLNPRIMPLVRRRAPGRIVTLSSVAGLIGNRVKSIIARRRRESSAPLKHWHWSWPSATLP